MQDLTIIMLYLKVTRDVDAMRASVSTQVFSMNTREVASCNMNTREVAMDICFLQFERNLPAYYV
jgi:hypothetical protein